MHLLILKLYEAMETQDCIDTIVRELSREDMLLLADQGAKARATCWTKGFILSVGRTLADMAATGMNETNLRRSVEHMIVQMDGLFAKLPKGIDVNIMDLSMEIFNQACEDLEKIEGNAMIPANILGQAFASMSRKKAAQ